MTLRIMRAAALLVIAAFGLPAPAAAQQQQRPRPEITMTDLPTGIDWSDINNHGQLVGRTYTDLRVVIWHDGELTTIAEGAAMPANPACPDPADPTYPVCLPIGHQAPLVNDRGEVALYQDGQAVLWRNGRFVDLGGGADVSSYVDLNDRGQVLVRRYFGQREVLGLWSRGTFHEIGSQRAGEYRLRVPRLSGAGHVTATVVDLDCACARGLLWHRGRRTDLGEFGGLVNSRGQVASVENDPATGEPYAFIWEGGEVTRLPTLGGEQTYVEDINDRGQMVGTSERPGERTFRTVLWEGGEIVEIGPAGASYSRPIGINERGQVLIYASGENGRGLGFLWDDGELIPLPPLGDQWTSIDVRGFNERGQVYGSHSRLLGPRTPVIWQVRRRPG
jgi:uncharacterized membrane protein